MNHKKQIIIMLIAAMVYATIGAMQDLADILAFQKYEEPVQASQIKSHIDDIPEEVKEKLHPHLYQLPSRAELLLARRHGNLLAPLCFEIASCFISYHAQEDCLVARCLCIEKKTQ